MDSITARGPARKCWYTEREREGSFVVTTKCVLTIVSCSSKWVIMYIIIFLCKLWDIRNYDNRAALKSTYNHRVSFNNLKTIKNTFSLITPIKPFPIKMLHDQKNPSYCNLPSVLLFGLHEQAIVLFTIREYQHLF